MKVKIFDGFVAFFNFLEQQSMLDAYPEFQSFVHLYKKINVGCGCQKAVRVKKTEEQYDLLARQMSLFPVILQEIKNRTETEEVQFHMNGVLIFKG